MANPTDKQRESRSCPTRLDGAATLFAHRLSPAQCQQRQRKLYHKCFTCALNNAQVAAHGLPEDGASAERGQRPAPTAKAAGGPTLEPLERIGKGRAEQTVA
ncbi:MAG: hypothetical protein QF903_03680 [Planctomycetota bacterium]|jgi:hypothetical protein|nr:hypothetical protein [Planctomycetota bacterium]MDP6762717.1 hypothetical protein [Planctomycetota bacterium]MDP6988557.1 hypothetical protein [Planctomycetota bacterium]